MKKSILSLLMSLFFGVLCAQNLFLDKGKTTHKGVHYSYLQLDINYLNYPIKKSNTNGLSVNGAVIFNDRLGTGLSLDLTDSREITFIRDGKSEPNVFEFSQFSWYNEVFFHPNSRIDVSLPFKLGLGHATVNPQDKFQFGQTLFSSKDILAEDYFFVSEFGVNISVHLIRTLDFNVGSTYRIVSGANGFITDNDFFNYAIHAGFRFRLAGKKM